MYLDIDDNGIIQDCKFKTFDLSLRCYAANSMATELVKEKLFREALEVTNKAVMEALDGLPPVKGTLFPAGWGSHPLNTVGLCQEKHHIKIEGLSKPRV